MTPRDVSALLARGHCFVGDISRVRLLRPNLRVEVLTGIRGLGCEEAAGVLMVPVAFPYHRGPRRETSGPKSAALPRKGLLRGICSPPDSAAPTSFLPLPPVGSEGTVVWAAAPSSVLTNGGCAVVFHCTLN